MKKGLKALLLSAFLFLAVLGGIHEGAAADSDGDGIPDGTDNCPAVSNPDQTDKDTDGTGDACDTDDDNDGVADERDKCPFDNASGLDANKDGCKDTVCDLRNVIQALTIQKGVTNSLMSKAANACTQYTKGKNTSSAQNMLKAFINEVKAQKGKKINDADATLLIQFTQNAIKSMSVK